MMSSLPYTGFHKDRQQQCYEINHTKNVRYLNQQTFLPSETLALFSQTESKNNFGDLRDSKV